MSFTIDRSVMSPNFDKRLGGKPKALVIHTTEGRWPSDLQWLSSSKSGVSCHYVISPAGVIHQIVRDEDRAWHAGVGSYLGFSDWNSISIGIELSHKRGDKWPPVQMEALSWLCRSLVATYSIRATMIVAHRWIAPDRRSDPTDWPDDQFVDWIGKLYTVDYAAEWGSAAPFHPTSGIPTRFIEDHKAGKSWGKALTHEFIHDGVVYQRFELAIVTWTSGGGVTVYRRNNV